MGKAEEKLVIDAMMAGVTDYKRMLASLKKAVEAAERNGDAGVWITLDNPAPMN